VALTWGKGGCVAQPLIRTPGDPRAPQAARPEFSDDDGGPDTGTSRKRVDHEVAEPCVTCGNGKPHEPDRAGEDHEGRECAQRMYAAKHALPALARPAAENSDDRWRQVKAGRLMRK